MQGQVADQHVLIALVGYQCCVVISQPNVWPGLAHVPLDVGDTKFQRKHYGADERTESFWAHVRCALRRATRLDDVAVVAIMLTVMVVPFRDAKGMAPRFKSVVRIVIWPDSVVGRSSQTLASLCITSGGAPCVKSAMCIIIIAKSGVDRSDWIMGLRADVLTIARALHLRGSGTVTLGARDA